MTLLIGAWTVGLILSLLALGVFISFRVFHFPDITADGSITLGASVAAVLLVAGVNPIVATGAAFASRAGGRCDHGCSSHQIQHTQALVGNSGHDGSLLGQSARDGQK